MINSNKPINVWVNPNPERAEYEIWVFESSTGTNTKSLHFENGVIVKVPVSESSILIGEGALPFMRVPFIMAQFLFPELITALQKHPNNFTPVPEATLKGELTATKEHLADMQKITDKLFKLLEPSADDKVINKK